MKTSDDLKRYTKCPMCYYLDNTEKKKLTFRQHMNNVLYDKYIELAKQYKDIRTTIDDIKKDINIPPLNVESTSVEQINLIHKQAIVYTTSYYEQVLLNKNYNIQSTEKSIVYVVGHTPIEAYIDIVVSDKKENYYGILLDFSTRNTTEIQRSKDPRVMIIEHAFRRDTGDSPNLLWLSLSENKLYKIDNRNIDLSSYISDLDMIVENFKGMNFYRRQGFWCNSCEYFETSCHN